LKMRYKKPKSTMSRESESLKININLN
jgi:hypothetical protein